MINVNTGEIIIGDNLIIINKNLNEKTLLSSKLYDKVESNYEINGWKYYTTEVIDILGTGFMMTFVFKKSKLNNVSLKHFGTIEERPFDVENEKKRQEIHNEWLQRILGESYETYVWGIKYKFEWGEVTSSFDPRTPQSEIYISYKKR